MNRYNNLKEYCESQPQWNSWRTYNHKETTLEFYNDDLIKHSREDIKVINIVEKRDSRTHNIVTFRCLKCGCEYNKEYREGRKTPCRNCVPSKNIFNVNKTKPLLEKPLEIRVKEELLKRGWKFVKSDFKNVDDYIYFVCDKGHSHRITPHALFSGVGCAKCYYSIGGYRYESEEELCKYIENKGFKVERNKTFYYCGVKRELDIYVPEKNLGIEYNGLYWHSTAKVDWNYHMNKRLMFQNLGIRIIFIWDNIYKRNPNLFKNKLDHILGVNNAKVINTRNTEIKQVDSAEYYDFMTKYHIQGSDNPKYRIGLIYKNELVACIGLSRPNMCRSSKVQLGKNQMELTRFATNIKYKVPGALSKILKYIKDNINVNSVYSYADLDVVSRDKNVYKSVGFEEEKIVRPSYSYHVGNNIVEHRYKYRKQMLKKKFPDLYSDSKTEKQIMSELGIYQIWNSGFIKYRYYFKREDN